MNQSCDKAMITKTYILISIIAGEISWGILILWYWVIPFNSYQDNGSDSNSILI